MNFNESDPIYKGHLRGGLNYHTARSGVLWCHNMCECFFSEAIVYALLLFDHLTIRFSSLAAGAGTLLSSAACNEQKGLV